MADQISTDGKEDGMSQYWEEHWDQYSEATRLNPAQMLRRRLIFRLLDLAPSRCEQATILDVGCGSGDMLVALGEHYPKASFAGIDRSQSGLEVTRKKVSEAQLIAVDLGAVTQAPSEITNWASHAVCSEVLEHVADPVAVLKHLQDYLKPGGCLVVTVPGGPKSAFDRSIGHIRHYTPELITQQLEQAGFQVDIAGGAGFPTFNLYRLVILLRGERLSQDIGGKPGVLARFAMAVFRVLMRVYLFKSPWGWQIIARARKPE